MTEWPGKADMLSFQITFDLCKASGNELAQFSTIFRYSVPIIIAREYDRMTRKGRYVIVSNYFWSL